MAMPKPVVLGKIEKGIPFVNNTEKRYGMWINQLRAMDVDDSFTVKGSKRIVGSIHQAICHYKKRDEDADKKMFATRTIEVDPDTDERIMRIWRIK